ncbi:MAG: hypothetical protein V1875_03560 [Candidatus Altiarchaeota archaeon]
MNLTNNEIARLRVGRIIGHIVEVRSHYAGDDPEFALEADPQGQWKGNATGDIHGGSIVFRGGFHACVMPEPYNMPSGGWVVLSGDGRNIILSKEKNVCISYP